MPASQSNKLQKAIDSLAKGDGEKVIDICRKILKKEPKNFDVLHLLGIGYRLEGRSDKALACYLEALDVRPEGSATLFCNLAFAYLETPGKSVFKADAFAMKARALSPSLPEAYEVSASVALRVHDTIAAESAIKKAIGFKPDSPALKRKLAAIYRVAARYDDAVEVINRALEMAPNSAEVVLESAEIFEMRGETEQALAAFDRAMLLDPGMEEDLIQRSIGVLSTHGRPDELRRRVLQRIEQDPKHLPSHLALLRTGAYPGGTDEGVKILRRLSSGGSTRVLEEFAIADGLDKEKRYDDSFPHYLIANRLKKKLGAAYSLSQTQRSFDRIRAIFDADVRELMTPCENPHDYPTPIFILGLPRSGTSLTEQLLGSHSGIFPAGELQFLLSLIKYGNFEYPAAARQSRAEYWDWVRDTYLSSIRALSGNAPFVIDKMPDNFQLLGILRELFPNSIVIHTFRDPVSNCLSLFKANFVGNHPYAQDLELLGQYYAEYHALMDFWQQRYGDGIYHSRYEDLVADMRPAVERMLALCGLEWEDEIENFHSADRIVRTASNDQVRQPIYQSAVKGWKKYEKHLGPLIASLKTAGVITDADLE